MKYHRRLLEEKLLDYHDSFTCVLVAGARQVGKSTLVEHVFGRRLKPFTFDPVQDLYGERSDPDLFLRNNPPPLILDEIQYVPELVPALKRYVDAHRAPGLFVITGSQQWEVMRALSESLAGRVGILDLPAFSLSESADDAGLCWFPAWLRGALRSREDAIAAMREAAGTERSPAQLIWRGFFPEVQTLRESAVPGWMRGYVATYLQRDVRRMLEVRDETQFATFLGLCAALTAQEINYRQLGRDIGLSTPSAKNWLSALRGTFQWLELPAFSHNQLKKLSQKSKGYLTDTGLASYLLRLSSPDGVQGHPSFGALFETMVVCELHKQAQLLPLVPAFYHYRQHSGMEIDLVADIDGRLFPIEIKASSSVRPADARAISTFQTQIGPAAGPGLVIYAGTRTLQLADGCMAVPFDVRGAAG